MVSTQSGKVFLSTPKTLTWQGAHNHHPMRVAPLARGGSIQPLRFFNIKAWVYEPRDSHPATETPEGLN